MTAQAQELDHRIASITQLGNVVTAIRSIAAARAQRSQEHLAGLQRYSQTLAEAIAQALRLSAAPPAISTQAQAATAALLFCAEQGFAGGFNEQVFAAAGTLQGRPLLLVGRRGLPVAHAQHLPVSWQQAAPLHLDSASPLADQIAEELMRRLGSGEIGRVEIVYTALDAAQKTVVHKQWLLPLDLRRFSSRTEGPPPLLQLPPESLLRDLMLEYLRAELMQALVQSYAAENQARLQAMSAARDNIQRNLEQLQRQARIVRQEAITAEVVELSVGTRAQQHQTRATVPTQQR